MAVALTSWFSPGEWSALNNQTRFSCEAAAPAVAEASTEEPPTMSTSFLCSTAADLALVMVLAAGHHLMYAEYAMLPANGCLGGLALFVAWGRWFRAPIYSRASAVGPDLESPAPT